MPQIAQIKEIDGEVWVRVGVPGDFPSGITLWTPEEVEAVKRDAVNAYIYEQRKVTESEGLDDE